MLFFYCCIYVVDGSGGLVSGAVGRLAAFDGFECKEFVRRESSELFRLFPMVWGVAGVTLWNVAFLSFSFNKIIIFLCFNKKYSSDQLSSSTRVQHNVGF
jgi:hypothetical protein